MSDEVVKYLQNHCQELTEQICHDIKTQPSLFPHYSRLEAVALRVRVAAAVDVVTTLAGDGNLEAVRQFTSSITQNRLQTGFDPEELIKFIEVLAQRTIEMIAAASVRDEGARRLAIRHIKSANSLSKMNVSGHNIAMSGVGEKHTEIDPDLPTVGSQTRQNDN